MLHSHRLKTPRCTNCAIPKLIKQGVQIVKIVKMIHQWLLPIETWRVEPLPGLLPSAMNEMFATCKKPVDSYQRKNIVLRIRANQYPSTF
jgi:hypothetical protein